MLMGMYMKNLFLYNYDAKHLSINNLLYLIMTIEIKNPVTKEKVQQAIEQLNKETEKKSLRKHFGKLKRNLDGLEYQKQVRNEWV